MGRRRHVIPPRDPESRVFVRGHKVRFIFSSLGSRALECEYCGLRWAFVSEVVEADRCARARQVDLFGGGNAK